jgi:hypothetical protein
MPPKYGVWKMEFDAGPYVFEMGRWINHVLQRGHGIPWHKHVTLILRVGAGRRPDQHRFLASVLPLNSPQTSHRTYPGGGLRRSNRLALVSSEYSISAKSSSTLV